MATIGKVVLKNATRSTIVAPNFAPKPNVSLSEINDVTVTGVENGDALVYNSTTGKFEANTITATVVAVIGGTF